MSKGQTIEIELDSPIEFGQRKLPLEIQLPNGANLSLLFLSANAMDELNFITFLVTAKSLKGAPKTSKFFFERAKKKTFPILFPLFYLLPFLSLR